MILEDLVQAFTGNKLPEPFKIKFKLKDKHYYAYISLGEIRLQKSVGGINVKELEEKYKARIGLSAGIVIIQPKLDLPYLCNIDEECTNKLKKWLKDCGLPLVRELLKQYITP